MSRILKAPFWAALSVACLLTPLNFSYAGETDLNRETCRWDKSKGSYKEFLKKHPSCSPAAGSLAFTGIQRGMNVNGKGYDRKYDGGGGDHFGGGDGNGNNNNNGSIGPEPSDDNTLTVLNVPIFQAPTAPGNDVPVATLGNYDPNSSAGHIETNQGHNYDNDVLNVPTFPHSNDPHHP